MGLLVAGISWLWNRLSLKEVEYERNVHQNRVFIGEETTLSISITNGKPIPLGRVEIIEQFPEEIQVADANISLSPNRRVHVIRLFTSMSWYERITWVYKIKSHQRGFFRLGPARIESGDLFGFFTSHMDVTHNDYLLVYPQIVPLPELGLPATRPLGDTKGGISIFDDPTRPQGIRDYQVNDPLKRVDWKISAKTNGLKVRTYDPSSSHVTILVVVVETTLRTWEGYNPVYLERVITASASIASYAFEMRYSLGLFSNGTPILADRPMKIPPARNNEQLSVILEALATIRPVPMGPMASQLNLHAKQFPIGATLAIVVALINSALMSSINDLTQQGYKLVVIFVGDEDRPELPNNVTVYEIGEYFRQLEVENQFGQH